MAAYMPVATGQVPGKLLEQVRTASTDEQRTAAYNKLVLYYKPVNADSAYRYAEQGLAAAVAHKDIAGEANMIELMGRLDQSQGRLESARQRILYALSLYTSTNHMVGIASMNNSLGAIEATQGNNEAAMAHFLNALKIYDSLKKDPEGRMVSNMNLGCLYLQNGDTINATRYLTRAEEISKKIPISDFTISLYNYIGVEYAIKGNMDKALEYFKKNVAISDKPEFTPSHVEALLYLGSFYNDQGDIATAMEYLQQGLAIAREKKLKETEADILLQIGNMISAKDPDAGLRYVNQALETSEQMQSKTLKIDIYKEMARIYELKGDHKSANDALRKSMVYKDSVTRVNKIKELAGLGAVYELEKSNMRVAEVSRQRNLVIGFSALLAGALAAAVVLYLKTRKMNVQLIKNEAELRELSNTKNKLFSIIGHDLRWPVARIPTILDIVDDESLEEEEKKYMIDSLREHTKATVETLDKLLYWGKSLMNGLQLAPEWFNPKPYILQTIELRKMAAMEKDITVGDRVADDIELFTDPNHFDFIIRNLFSNAIKFTPVKGEIYFEVDKVTRPGFYIFSVNDNGVGIDEQRMKKIFEPFNSKLGTANEKGTGIGLMLCKEFAMKNGGDLWATSEPGVKTSFYLSIPVKKK
jgi:signal transduction histidine kinase